MFYSLEPLDKYSQYYHSNTGLDFYISLFKQIIAIILIVEKRLFECDEGINTITQV